MRFGLVGCGIHGSRYLRHLHRDVDEASPVGLFRRSRDEAERIAMEYGIRAFGSLDELLDSPEVDAVLIVTPPGGHLEELRRAVATGKPVLIEKPLTATWEQARALDSLDGERVMVAQTLRFSPVLQRTKERLAEIGTLHRFRVAQRLEPSALAWQSDPSLAGAGSITLTGVHLFDLLRWMVGRTPDRVRCDALALDGHPVENLFDACFHFEPEQILAATEVSKFSRGRSALLELVGTDGQLVVDYMRGQLYRVEGREWTLLEDFGDVPTLIGTLRHFVQFVRGEIENPVTVRDGCETLRMADACYRSSATGSVAMVREEAA